MVATRPLEAVMIAIYRYRTYMWAKGGCARRPPGAFKPYSAGLVIIDLLARSDPRNADSQRELSVSYEKIGDVQVAQGDLTGALTSYRDSFAIIDRLVTARPKNAEWRRHISISYDKIGEVQHAQGDPIGALTSYRSSLAITHHLARSDPGNVSLQFDLGITNEESATRSSRKAT